MFMMKQVFYSLTSEGYVLWFVYTCGYIVAVILTPTSS